MSFLGIFGKGMTPAERNDEQKAILQRDAQITRIMENLGYSQNDNGDWVDIHGNIKLPENSGGFSMDDLIEDH